jgi:type IV secretion system protein VirB10
MQAGDMQGFSGLSDQVDRHLLQAFGKALIYAGVSAGTGIAQGGFQGRSYYDPYSPGDAASAALGRELGQAANQSLRRGEDIRPTLTIRPGYEFTVTLIKDLVFKEAWSPLEGQRDVIQGEQ